VPEGRVVEENSRITGPPGGVVLTAEEGLLMRDA
jgi:hypothetical protein